MELTQRLRQLVGDSPPITIERFLNELWTVYPHGDPEGGYVQVCLHIGKRTFRGEKITFEMIIKKRSMYVGRLQRENQAKFIKHLQNWLLSGGLNEETVATRNTALDRFR